MKEGSSNVLENSMILAGSGISNGQNHSKGDIPIVMAGTGGGKIKTNRHIVAPNKSSIATLHRSVMDIMNVDGELLKGKGGTLKDF